MVTVVGASVLTLLGLGTMAITPILISAALAVGAWYLYDLIYEEEY